MMLVTQSSQSLMVHSKQSMNLMLRQRDVALSADARSCWCSLQIAAHLQDPQVPHNVQAMRGPESLRVNLGTDAGCLHLDDATVPTTSLKIILLLLDSCRVLSC